MKTLFANFLAAASLLLAMPVTAGESDALRMAITTSTDNSGLFSVIQPAIEAAVGRKLHLIAVGTGKALELGRRGDVDVVLVHAKPAEEAFVANGYGVQRHEIMYNDFIVVGPADDPAGVRGLQDAAVALDRIAQTEAVFVSRGDDSGTHKKEQSLWLRSGQQPDGNWYRQVGQGMGKTLQIAGEMQGYTLVDRGTWLAYRATTPLELLVSGGNDLQNPYGIIAVNAIRFPDVNSEAAARLIHWFESDEAHQLIAGYRVEGEQLFYPIEH